MKKSGIARGEIFLETKLWPAFYNQSDAVEKTLQRLDTDYIDVLFLHNCDDLKKRYHSMAVSGKDCIHCGSCTKRCPFGIDASANMQRAQDLFGC